MPEITLREPAPPNYTWTEKDAQKLVGQDVPMKVADVDYGAGRVTGAKVVEDGGAVHLTLEVPDAIARIIGGGDEGLLGYSIASIAPTSRWESRESFERWARTNNVSVRTQLDVLHTAIEEMSEALNSPLANELADVAGAPKTMLVLFCSRCESYCGIRDVDRIRDEHFSANGPCKGGMWHVVEYAVTGLHGTYGEVLRAVVERDGQS